MEKKFLIILIGLILAVGSLGFVVAQSATFTNYQTQADFQTYYPSTGDNSYYNYWPILSGNNSECVGRQDILLNVAPGGCQPMIVRSDLLADQNVPVLCQIDALQINPLLNIKQISNIRFTQGSNSKDVAAVGFHPARAALNTRDTLLGSPLINNIGYVVVVLKRNPVEKSLPDFVNVTLSAQLEYDSGNALGIGKAQFVLSPITNDADWEKEKAKQSFWNGRYYLRLNAVDENFASISIYDGSRVISSTKVKKGVLSNDIYFPGSYCMASVQASYDGFESAKDSAILKVTDDSGTDTVQGYSSSLFYNDLCRVDSVTIDKTDPELGNVAVVCGSQKITLEKKATREFNVGDSVFYRVGSESLHASVVSGLNNGIYGIKLDSKDDIAKLPKDVKVDSSEVFNASKGQVGTEPINNVLSGDSQTTFNNAMAAFERVANDFPAENMNQVDSPIKASYYGEDSLDRAITISRQFGQYAKEKELLEKIIKLYPGSSSINKYNKELSEIHIFDLSSITQVINLNNRYVTVQLTDLKKASKIASAIFSSKSGDTNPPLTEGKSTSNGWGGFTSVTVKSIRYDGADVDVSCVDTTTGKATTERASFVNGEEKKICGLYLTLKSVDAAQVAKIRLIPKASYTKGETNLTVAIGIEKRNIKLSPEKRKEMIKNLNDSIAKWEKISKSLGNVVTGLKGACFATSLVLMVKNFVSGIGGNTLARQQTMSGDNGWTKKCQTLVSAGTYRTMSECYSINNNNITKEIQDRAAALQNVNSRIANNVENQAGISQSSLLGGTSVDTNQAIKVYYSVLATKWGQKLVDAGITEAAVNSGAVSYQDLRDVDYNLELNRQYDSSKKISEISSRVSATQTVIDTSNSVKAGWGATPTSIGMVPQNIATGQVLSISSDGKIGSVAVTGVTLPSDAKSAMLVTGYTQATKDKPSTLTNFVVVGNKVGNQLVPSAVYNYTDIATTSTGKSVSLTAIPAYSGVANAANFGPAYGISSFVDSGSALSGNRITNSLSKQVIFFGSGPDKGLAQQVPFDLNNGWYAKVESSLNVGNNIKSYDSSGRPRSWYICNVGIDGTVSSNDDCQLYIDGSGNQKILGLSDSQSANLISNSRQALIQASSQANNKVIKVLGQDLIAGAPTSVFSGVECQQFMNIQDCNILFNVCDPVICPASRCNLGGKYPVADVASTGIIGSAILCLPNFGLPQNGGVLIPVCLTGIEAGIDSYVSILKNHRDCLQNSLDTGQMTGICDEIYSLYICDMFWNNLGPFVNNAIPALVQSLYTGNQGATGGGEYLTVKNSWDNMQSSLNYFTQSYAVNSFQSFQVRSIADIGGEVCKGYVSAKGPSSFKSLVQPDSPPQFTAWFSSEKYSDATVPATAQYKVFYHIFAGKSNAVQYQVYLKNPPESPYYATAQVVTIATGFIKQGEYASETKDFTAPEGYRELCIRINNEDKCGFGQVSTSFAVNYLSDQYASSQINATGITSAGDCISGTPSLAVSANPQDLLQRSILPQDYNRGIVRICSTRNPAESTEPARYVEVGYCDNQQTKCWLDKNSVSNAISDSDRGVLNQTLSSLEQIQQNLLAAQGQSLPLAEASAKLKELADKTTKIEITYNANEAQNILGNISDTEPRLVLNPHKAQILFLRARVLGKIARFSIEKKEAVAVKFNPFELSNLPTGQGTTNINIKSVQAASNNGNAVLAVDGNINTAWSSAEKIIGATYYINLTKKMLVKSVNVSTLSDKIKIGLSCFLDGKLVKTVPEATVSNNLIKISPNCDADRIQIWVGSSTNVPEILSINEITLETSEIEGGAAIPPVAPSAAAGQGWTLTTSYNPTSTTPNFIRNANKDTAYYISANKVMLKFVDSIVGWDWTVSDRQVGSVKNVNNKNIITITEGNIADMNKYLGVNLNGTEIKDTQIILASSSAQTASTKLPSTPASSATLVVTKPLLTMNGNIIALSQIDGESQLRNLSLQGFETTWFYKDSKWIFNSRGEKGAGSAIIDISKVPSSFGAGVSYHTHYVPDSDINPYLEFYKQGQMSIDNAKSNLINSFNRPRPPTFPEDYIILDGGYSSRVVGPAGVWKYSKKPTGIDDIALRNKYLAQQGKEDVQGYITAINQAGGDLSYTPFTDTKFIEEYVDRLLK